MRPLPHSLRIWTAVACCTTALAVAAWAQGRKAGLYDVTSTMTWQQSPFPAGMGPAGGPHASQVCVTQEQIDKYGTVPPQARGECEVTNFAKKDNGYTADISCTGRMATKGTVTASYDGSGHGKTTIHLMGNFQMGPNSKPVEYTIVNESTYKGADCGSVQPTAVK